jgi:hypothetical protein
MIKTPSVVVVAALALTASPAAFAYDAETYTSAKCGITMAIPAGTKAQVTEAMGADGLCKVDLAVEGVEFHGVSKKDTSVTLAEAETWVAKYTGIAADKWTKFDEAADHIGYKASAGGKNVWAAAAKGGTFSCVAFVRAPSAEPEADLDQFYKSLDCQ